MESATTRALSHLHPLDFNLSDLSSLTSTQLSLVQFHVEADSFDPSIPLKVYREWSQRRERSRGRLRSLPSQLEQDTQLHTIDLSFELSNLNQLDSNQLAVVQFHPECTELLQLKAEMIWRSRRERDFSRGFVWKDEKPEVTDATQRRKEQVMEGEATSTPAEHSMEVVASSLSKCVEDGSLQRPQKELEMEIQTENTSRREDQQQPVDEGTPPRPDEPMDKVIQEPSLPPSSPEATPEKALPPPFVPSQTSPTTYAPLSRPSTPPSQVVASAPLALGFNLPNSPITALPQKISPRKTASRSPSASPELIILATPYPPPSKSLPPPFIPAKVPRPTLPPIPPRPWGSTPLTLQFSSLIYSLRLFNLPSLEIYESSSLLSLFPAKLKPIASNLRPLPPQEFLRHGYVGFPTFDARTEAFQAVTGKRLLGGNHLIGVEFVEDVEWEWRNLNYEWAEGVWRREMRRKLEVEQKEKEEILEREREEKERREVEVAEKFPSPAPTITPEPSVESLSKPASRETSGSLNPLLQPQPSLNPDAASNSTFNRSSTSTTNLASSRPYPTPSAILEALVLPPTLTNKFPQLFITFSSPPLQVQQRAPFQLLGLASIIGIQPECEGPKCRMFFLAFESREHLTIARERLATKHYGFVKEYGMRVQLRTSEDWKIEMFTFKFRKVIVRELADRGSGSMKARLPSLASESSASLASSLLPALPISPTTVAPSIPFIPSAPPSLTQQTLHNPLPISTAPTIEPTLDTDNEPLPPPSLTHLPTPIIPSFDPTLDTNDRLLPSGWKRRWSITHSTWYYLDSEERSSWSNPLDEDGENGSGSGSGSDMDVGDEEEVDAPRREEEEVDILEESTPLEGISGDVLMQETAGDTSQSASWSLRIPPTTSSSTPIASPTLPTGPRIPREPPKDNAARYGYASSYTPYPANGNGSPSRIQGSSYFPSRPYPSGKFTPNPSYSNSGRGSFQPPAYNPLSAPSAYKNSTYARISAPLPTSFPPPPNIPQNSQPLSSFPRPRIPSSPGKATSTGPSHHHHHHHQTSHHPLPIRPQFVPSPPRPPSQSSTPPYPRSHADSSSSYHTTYNDSPSYHTGIARDDRYEVGEKRGRIDERSRGGDGDRYRRGREKGGFVEWFSLV